MIVLAVLSNSVALYSDVLDIIYRKAEVYAQYSQGHDNTKGGCWLKSVYFAVKQI